jgi:hypothetical protein
LRRRPVVAPAPGGRRAAAGDDRAEVHPLGSSRLEPPYERCREQRTPRIAADPAMARSRPSPDCVHRRQVDCKTPGPARHDRNSAILSPMARAVVSARLSFPSRTIPTLPSHSAICCAPDGTADFRWASAIVPYRTEPQAGEVIWSTPS